MENIYYSTNEETFNFDSIDEAFCDVFESEDSFNVGDVVTVYSGEAIKNKASDYLSGNLLEDMQERAYDEAGEFAEDYLIEAGIVEQNELLKELSDAVDKWADKYGFQPKFYGIRNIKEINARILNIETGEYEVIGGHCGMVKS